MPIFDEDDNPMQHGLTGWGDETTGFSFIKGPCLGIVLAIHFADSRENLLFEYMQGADAQAGDEKKKASHVAASVLLVQGTTPLSYRLDNCIILQGKTSASNNRGIPADYSEDLPTPSFSSLSEVEEYFGRGIEGGISQLRGDWVLVDFIGGVQEMPVISRWYPNPFNQADPASGEDGLRTLYRRNNTSALVDKNGDLSITHARGQYIQLKGQRITIKHRQGSVFDMNEDGEIVLVERGGNTLQLSEDGFAVATESCAFQMNDTEGDISLRAPTRSFNVSAKTVSLVGLSVHATDGQSAGEGLVKGDLIPSTVRDIVNVLTNLPSAIGGDPQAISEVAQGVASLNLKKSDLANKLKYLTRIFRAE